MDNLDNFSVTHPRQCPTIAEASYTRVSIKHLDHRIKELQNQLELLQRQRGNLTSFISPFRCLPVEILQTIAQLCLDGGVSVTVMTQICGRLRDVVTGMTTPWGNIYLSPKRGSYPHRPELFLEVCYHVCFIIRWLMVIS
jgi:hypothetical protein